MMASSSTAGDIVAAATAREQQQQQQRQQATTTTSKIRTPKCARCRNHGYTVNLRGHKGFCPHKSCTCELCDLVKERQEVSKRQIKLRRQQQQEEVMGMHVPVPPSIFAQGSIYGMNLDYLRVLFPQKRVDRLYAVLLQCNNDVDTASVKLQQEEHPGERRESQMNKTAQAASVVKINKGTQWPVDSDQASADIPSTAGTIFSKGRGQKCNAARSAEESQRTANHFHCPPPPFCWAHALPSPAQFIPIDSMSVSSCDVFSTVASRALVKQDVLRAERFSLGSSAALEGFEPLRGSVLGPAKASEQNPGISSMVVLASTSHLSEASLTALQGLESSMGEMSELEARWSSPSCTLLPLKATPKVSQWDCGPVYTSASTTSTTWMDTAASVLAPKMDTAASVLVPKMPVPFSLPAPPPPSLPPFPPGWDPRSLPPLPFLQASMAGRFHGAPSFQLSPPPHLSHSPALPHVKEAVPSPEKAVCSDQATGERSDQGKSEPKVNSNDLSILEVCHDSEQLIDSTGLGFVSE